MIRFLRIGKFRFLKRFRMAVVLIKGAFNVVFFEHYHYFVFCLALALVQFIAFSFTGLIHSKLKLSFLLSESLSGLNYFEILFESIWNLNTPQLLTAAILLFIQLFLIFIISSATSYYVMQKLNHEKQSIKKSFLNALNKIRPLGIFACLEVIIMLLCAFLGIAGSIAYFLWQLLTVFNIQIITFESINILAVFLKSLRYFKTNITNILSIDIALELFLIAMALFGYFFYQKTIVEPISLLADNYAIAILILYVMATVNLIEVVAFTFFYNIINKGTRV